MFDKNVLPELSTTTDPPPYHTSYRDNDYSNESYYGNTNNSNNNNYYYNYGEDVVYDDYIYQGYSFERPVYLYIWEVLVIFTSIVNIVVLSVLLQKKMRSSTNTILAAIAISDSLAGLVTLPTYIMVFMRYDPAPKWQGYGVYNTNQSADQNPFSSYPFTIDSMAGYVNSSMFNECDSYVSRTNENISENNLSFQCPSVSPPSPTHKPLDGYILTKSLCRGFMLSKYFLSKWFHTTSIFLTLLLGVMRFISIAFPFFTPFAFSSVRRTAVCCMVIFLLSPVLHIFHLSNEKAVDGQCQWELTEKGCESGCVYLWMVFLFRHCIPCITLIVFTVLFIRELNKGEVSLRRMDIAKSQMSRRLIENRRIIVLVVSIVIVYLIPEVPYVVFLLYNAIDKTIQSNKETIETNRLIHMTYELLLVVSFHVKVYIYILFNKRFYKTLKQTFISPITRLIVDKRNLSLSRPMSESQRTTLRKRISFAIEH